MATTSRRRPAQSRTARNDDWTDREILGIVDEAAREDVDESASTTEIGIKMGFSANRDSANKTPATAVGSRLAWMRDGGLLESLPPDLTRPFTEPGARDTRWRLTRSGQEILSGKLTKTITNAVDRMSTGDKIVLVKELMRTGYIEGDATTAFAMDRQVKHDRAKRKLVFRAAR